MSLTSAFNIARSGLTAGQIGIQVAGNNIANASTPGYSRQVARLAPIRGDRTVPNVSIGNGVRVTNIERQVDQALLDRLWATGAQQIGAGTLSNMYGAVQDALGELGDNDLSSELSSFFNAWSERANQTSSSAAVVQSGERLATFVKRLRSDLVDLRSQSENELSATVKRANDLMQRVADLNRDIGQAEIAGHPSNTLRDQRDQAVTELSEYFELTAVDRGPQGMDILVGSIPVVLGTQNRGLQVKTREEGDGVRYALATVADGSELPVRSGKIGALLTSRDDAINGTIDAIDHLASQLVFEVNKLHATGRNAAGIRSTTGTMQFATADRDLALTTDNPALLGQPGKPKTGSFLIHVRDSGTGTEVATRINIDLDGLTNAGLPGSDDDTSAEDIRAALDAIAGVKAEFTADGKLKVSADDGFEFSFDDDTSDAVATLGLNSFFTGTSGESIAVRSDLLSDPAKLTAGRMVNGQFVENGNALRIVQLASNAVEGLKGNSFSGAWRDEVQRIAGEAASAASTADSASTVRDALEAQRQAVSGVSIDEESLNLLDYQRLYQGSAKIVTVANEMTQTLLNLI
jgi:flagellar hook-associated protein 1 FlgK